MKDANGKELTAEYEIPTEQERRQLEPWESAGVYQRYHEERDRQRRREARLNSRGLSIYERAGRFRELALLKCLSEPYLTCDAFSPQPSLTRSWSFSLEIAYKVPLGSPL